MSTETGTDYVTSIEEVLRKSVKFKGKGVRVKGKPEDVQSVRTIKSRITCHLPIS